MSGLGGRGRYVNISGDGCRLNPSRVNAATNTSEQVTECGKGFYMKRVVGKPLGDVKLGYYLFGFSIPGGEGGRRTAAPNWLDR